MGNVLFASSSGPSAFGDIDAQLCKLQSTSSIRRVTEAGRWQSERRLQLDSLMIRPAKFRYGSASILTEELTSAALDAE